MPVNPLEPKQFENLKLHCDKVIRSAIARLQAGDVPAFPIGKRTQDGGCSACSYCDYSTVCGMIGFEEIDDDLIYSVINGT